MFFEFEFFFLEVYLFVSFVLILFEDLQNLTIFLSQNQLRSFGVEFRLFIIDIRFQVFVPGDERSDVTLMKLVIS